MKIKEINKIEYKELENSPKVKAKEISNKPTIVMSRSHTFSEMKLETKYKFEQHLEATRNYYLSRIVKSN